MSQTTTILSPQTMTKSTNGQSSKQNRSKIVIIENDNDKVRRKKRRAVNHALGECNGKKQKQFPTNILNNIHYYEKDQLEEEEERSPILNNSQPGFSFNPPSADSDNDDDNNNNEGFSPPIFRINPPLSLSSEEIVQEENLNQSSNSISNNNDDTIYHVVVIKHTGEKIAKFYRVAELTSRTSLSYHDSHYDTSTNIGVVAWALKKLNENNNNYYLPNNEWLSVEQERIKTFVKVIRFSATVVKSLDKPFQMNGNLYFINVE